MTVEGVEAFPLCWPDGWPRKQYRNHSRYRVEFSAARDHLVHELRLAGARNVIVSTNVPLRRDGLPLANMRQPDDPGVAAYWDDRNGEPRVLAIDAWKTVRENMHAVGLAVEGLRMFERTGAGEVLKRAYSGFARLPASTSDGDHWRTLGLPRHGTTSAGLTQRYRELAREHHPDRPGGSAATMVTINDAYKRALAEVAR